MADKKLFDADLRTTPISTSQRIATGTPAGTTYNITVSDLSDWIIGNIPTPPTTIRRAPVRLSIFILMFHQL